MFSMNFYSLFTNLPTSSLPVNPKSGCKSKTLFSIRQTNNKNIWVKISGSDLQMNLAGQRQTITVF